MKKYKELLFLKNLKGMDNIIINKYYKNIILESIDFNDFILKIKNLDKTDKIWSKNKIENIGNIINVVEEKYKEICDNNEISILTIFDENYPKKLSIMNNEKPVILYAKGNIDILDMDNIAIIGTRKPSEFSKMMGKNIVNNIIEISNRVVVSGLAVGCDSIGHTSCINKKKPTVAVLSFGFNKIDYPSKIPLMKDIIKNGGCLITEYEPDEKSKPYYYVARDSIIAALSDSTFVIECELKSGTMHTVDACLKYKKKIAVYVDKKNKFEGNEYIANTLNGVKISSQQDIKDYLLSIV